MGWRSKSEQAGWQDQQNSGTMSWVTCLSLQTTTARHTTQGFVVPIMAVSAWIIYSGLSHTQTFHPTSDKQKHLPRVLLPQDPSERTGPWHNAVDCYWVESLNGGWVKYTRGKQACRLITGFFWWRDLWGESIVCDPFLHIFYSSLLRRDSLSLLNLLNVFSLPRMNASGALSLWH